MTEKFSVTLQPGDITLYFEDGTYPPEMTYEEKIELLAKSRFPGRRFTSFTVYKPNGSFYPGRLRQSTSLREAENLAREVYVRLASEGYVVTLGPGTCLTITHPERVVSSEKLPKEILELIDDKVDIEEPNEENHLVLDFEWNY